MLQKNIRYSYSFLDKFSIESKAPNSNDVILKSRDSQQLILMKEIEVGSQEYQETLATLEYQKSLSHEQLLALVDYYPQPAIHKFVVLYEYCSISLMDEFENRLAQRRAFSEPELWSIFTSLAFGLAYLQEQNVGHGSISLYDCFLNEQGFIKISDPTCATSNPYSISRGYFYAPEILRCLVQDTGEQINIFKSDAFSLGCCMLQLSLMRDATEIFDYQGGMLNNAALRGMLNELATRGFSREFNGFIDELLSYDLRDRPDFVDLKSQIFSLLSLDANEQNQQLMRQSYGIKSSISSLVRSKGQPNLNVRLPKEQLQIENKKSKDTKAALSAQLDSLFDTPTEKDFRQPLGQVKVQTINRGMANLTLFTDKPNVDYLFGNMKKSIHLDQDSGQEQENTIKAKKTREQSKSNQKVLSEIVNLQQNIDKIEFNLQKKRRNRESELDRRRFKNQSPKWRESQHAIDENHNESGIEESKARIIKKQLQKLFADSPQKSRGSILPQTISHSNITLKTQHSNVTTCLSNDNYTYTSQLISTKKQLACPATRPEPHTKNSQFISQDLTDRVQRTSGEQQLYTDPSFLEMMQADVQQILSKRKICYH